jgi:hypothetical protein
LLIATPLAGTRCDKLPLLAGAYQESPLTRYDDG